MTLRYDARMIAVACFALLACGFVSDDPTPEQIASGAALSPTAAVALVPKAARFRSVEMKRGIFRLDGEPYFAIQFQAPADVAERRLAWGFKRFDFRHWYIVGLDEPVEQGFTSFNVEGEFITQALPGERLEPGRRYALWLALSSIENPPFVYSLTLFKNSDIRDGHGPRPPLTNLEDAIPELAYPPFPQHPKESTFELTEFGRELLDEMARDAELQLEAELRTERGKDIPADLLAILADQPKGEITVNTDAAEASYKAWDLSEVTFSHQGRSYAVLTFAPERREGSSNSIDYSFVFPACDAYGFVAGDKDLGTYVVSPPEKDGNPQLVTHSLPAGVADLGETPPPITMWFRYNPASKPTLLLSLNWLPADVPLLPLLGPLPRP